MAKQPVSVKLYGILEDKSVAKTHQAADVIELWGDVPDKPGYFKVSGVNDEEGEYCVLFLQTPKSKIEFSFNRQAGIWQAEHNGVKIHISLKKIVGKLLYWA